VETELLKVKTNVVEVKTNLVEVKTEWMISKSRLLCQSFCKTFDSLSWRRLHPEQSFYLSDWGGEAIRPNFSLVKNGTGHE
jgi:hypothetical protein